MVEQSASPPKGEPVAVPYRDRLPSTRVLSEGPEPRHDDPEEVRRRERDDDQRQIGRLLAQLAEQNDRIAEQNDRIAQLQAAEQARSQRESMRPKAEEAAPTPSQWKAAAFKVLVSLGAVLTAAATILGYRAASLPPKVEAQEVRTTVTETKTDGAAIKLAALEGRVVMLEQRFDEKTLWDLEVWRLQGVQVRKPDALKGRGLPKIEVVVPAKPSDGYVMSVNTPPP